MLISLSIPGFSASSAETKTLYFSSNGYWDKFFALYAFDDNYDEGQWFSLSPVSGEEDVFSADIPADFDNVIFCSRSKLSFDWNYVVNKTDALTIPENCNHLKLSGVNTALWDKYVAEGKELIYLAPCEEWMDLQYISGHGFVLHAFSAQDTEGVWVEMEQVKGDFGAYPATFCAEIDSKYNEMEFCRVEFLTEEGTFTIWEKSYTQTQPEDMNLFTQDESAKSGSWSFTEYIEPETPEVTEPEEIPTLPESSDPSEKPESTKTIFFSSNEAWKETVSSSIGRISAFAGISGSDEGTWYWLSPSPVNEAEYSLEIDSKYDTISFGITFSADYENQWVTTGDLTIPEDSNHFTQSEENETEGTWSNITFDNSKYFSVSFIDADGKLISAQAVKEGNSATAPEAPEKEADAQYTYKFVGWDTDFSKIHEDTIVKALFTKTINKYQVSFKDYNGNLLSVVTVEYGKAATAPENPVRVGYTFKGWDTRFDAVYEDLTVTALYSKIVEPLTKGTLEVEVAGGTGFDIAISGGATRPQGTFYVNTKMAIAATVIITAKTTNSNTFIGWINENGLLVSTKPTYTFVTTGNDYLRAVYETDIEDAVLVTFKNDKANQILDSQHYMEGDEVFFPELPTNATHLATGWSMSAEEIETAIREGRNVTVVPTWEKIQIYVTVSVTGGTAQGLTGGKSLRYGEVTVSADNAPQNQKFAYWINQNGKVVSYKSDYTFYPAEDTSLTAVYVKESETIGYEVLQSIMMDTSSEDKDINTVFLSWEVPEGSGVTFVQAGALLVNSEKYDETTFYKGTPDTNVTKWTPTSINQIPSKTITVNKKGVEIGSTWYIQGWITYTVNGETVTTYTDLVSVIK